MKNEDVLIILLVVVLMCSFLCFIYFDVKISNLKWQISDLEFHIKWEIQNVRHSIYDANIMLYDRFCELILEYR